jgi:hypothetical protein
MHLTGPGGFAPAAGGADAAGGRDRAGSDAPADDQGWSDA